MVKKGLYKSKDDDWCCIDPRQEVVNHWGKYRAWTAPPVYFCGATRGDNPVFYLFEDYTSHALLS